MIYYTYFPRTYVGIYGWKKNVSKIYDQTTLNIKYTVVCVCKQNHILENFDMEYTGYKLINLKP